MTKTLVAGYFTGEFGWQLMAWQAKIRYMSKKYNKTIVGCEKQYKFLYHDFADEIHIYKGKPKNRNMWMSQQITMPMNHLYDGEQYKFLAPSRDFCLSDHYQGDFIKYGKYNKNMEYDILIHARSTDNFRTEYRNWPVKYWNKIVDYYNGCKIGSIGTTIGAHYINGTDDLRDYPLSVLADIMVSSKVLLSPSSGPVHYASLCGLSHVVWSDIRHEPIRGNNKDRYEHLWNPFRTKCYFIESWQPEPEKVIKNCDLSLSNIDNNI